MFDQIQCYFTVNKLTTDFQHVYREGYSTSTALTQMSDDWLKEIDDKKMVGAVLFDFSAAFDIVDLRLLVEKCTVPVKGLDTPTHSRVFLNFLLFSTL